MDETKTCIRCGMEKSIDNFTSRRLGRLRRTKQCHPCIDKRGDNDRANQRQKVASSGEKLNALINWPVLGR